MAEIVHYHESSGTEETTTSNSLAEITGRTIAWSDLTGAGFAASDEVFIIWSWSAGIDSTGSEKVFGQIGHGTTFAGRTDFLSAEFGVEAQDSSALNGHRMLGWIEEHTLVANENFYFALRSDDVLAGATARSGNWSITFLKKADLAADDYRFTEANTTGNTTTNAFATAISATLPSGGGDDWAILGCVHHDVASTAANHEQRLQVAGSNVMTMSLEGEDTAEELPHMSVYYHAGAGASDAINLQVREDLNLGHTYDYTRLLCLRMEAFADHVGTYTGTDVALSGSVDTYVEADTVSLSLSANGDVMVIGQPIIDAASTDCDPYLRIQEGGTDIVSNYGRASDHARDTTDFIPIWGAVVGNMTSGTKTIDLDVAQDETASASNHVEEVSLIAFSLELAGAGGVTITPPAATITLTEYDPTVTRDHTAAPNAETIQLNTYDPTIDIQTPGADVTVTPPAATITLTTYNPVIVVGADVTIQAPAATVTLTGYNPTVTRDWSVFPNAETIQLTTYDPTITVDADTTIQAPKATITLTAYDPNIAVSGNIQPGAGTIQIVGNDPIVIRDHTVPVPLGSVTINTYDPTIAFKGWQPTADASGTWTPATESSDIWTPVTESSDTWT